MSDRPKNLEYLHNIGRDAKILIWARLIVFQVSQYIIPGLKIHPFPPPTISKPPSCLFWLLLLQFLSRILTYPWLTSSLNLSLSLTISYPWLTLSQSLSKKREEAAFSWYGFFTPPVWWYTTVLLMIHHNSASDDTQQCSIAMLQCILWSLMIHHSAYIILVYPFWCIRGALWCIKLLYTPAHNVSMDCGVSVELCIRLVYTALLNSLLFVIF